MRTTGLPITLQQLYDKHFLGMTKIIEWIEGTLDIKISFKTHLTQSTILDFHIRHDNDYIEDGVGDPDPHGKLFHAYTTKNIEIPVPCVRLTEVMQIVKAHQFIGKLRIADNIVIETDVTNQFTMQKHLFACDYNWETIDVDLEFQIYHKWEELTMKKSANIVKSVVGNPEFKNMRPAAGGKVHKVVLMDQYTHQEIDPAQRRHPEYGKPGRVCEPQHNPLKGTNPTAWFGSFIETDKPITCGNCLRKYWPDGRKRV